VTTRTPWIAALALAGVLGTILVAAGVLGGGARGGAGDPVPRDPALTEVAALRDALAGCHDDLAAEQARFSAHERRVDSLRAVVEGHESAERTVPAADFDDYLEAFHAYNASVEAWPERASALEASWEACRVLTERHNAVVDSLSGRGGSEGGGSGPAPRDAPPSGGTPG
jgi:hypothetical protein